MITPNEQARKAQIRALQTLRTKSGWKISFSGTRDEETNRIHYKRLVEKAANIDGFPNVNALVLGSGAGYPAFYLAMYGLRGVIKGEDIDPDSVIISRILASYFGYPDVQKTFLNEGLAKARGLILKKIKERTQTNPLTNILFNCRDATQQRDPEFQYPLIVCDNIHNPEIIKDERKMQGLMFRINDLSVPGTILSYRYGTEGESLRRFGFREVSNNIYQKTE